MASRKEEEEEGRKKEASKTIGLAMCNKSSASFFTSFF